MKILLTERKRVRNFLNYYLQIQLILRRPLTPSNAVLGENNCSQFENHTKRINTKLLCEQNVNVFNVS